jgi:rubredoxin
VERVTYLIFPESVRPTYEKPFSKTERRLTMAQYECKLCGYIYDEEAGCDEQGVAPGTKWADVPDDFECPLCGASKDDFELK